MDSFVSIIVVFILGIIAVAIAGLVAGFSPTLYIAQATLSSKSKTIRQLTFALMAGVLAATIVLLILFQTFSLNSLLEIINSTVKALLVSVVFNIVVGLLFVFGGLRYLSTSDTQKAYDSEAGVKQVKKYKGNTALFGLGFIKTFLSISGATAIFVGGNIIATASNTYLERIILTAVFLLASIAPFLAVFYFLQRKPDSLQTLINKTKTRLAKVNYRSTVGFAAVILGGAIVIFNVMMALFY